MPEGYLTDQDITDILEFSNEHLLKNQVLFDDLKKLSSDELIDFLYSIWNYS